MLHKGNVSGGVVVSAPRWHKARFGTSAVAAQAGAQLGKAPTFPWDLRAASYGLVGRSSAREVAVARPANLTMASH